MPLYKNEIRVKCILYNKISRKLINMKKDIKKNYKA